MNKIIFASNNNHKLEEVRRIFKFYEVISLRDIGFTKEIVEDGYSFQENAYIKANAVAEYIKGTRFQNYAVLADDSGLCVRALNYEPGIMSSRYSGGGDEANRQLLLSKLTTIQDRTAYFQCYAVLILASGESMVADGKVYGLISKEKIGDESFGYDCIFWSDKLRKTFGQASAEEKDSVSHRAIAMQKIKDYLDEIDYLGIADDEEY
jgi:XTP/dITP diphosphohydrolase